MSAFGDRQNEIKWCSVSCALWNSVEERRADSARKAAEIDVKSSAGATRGGAALFGRRQRTPLSEESTIHGVVYEERKATALQRIHSEFRSLSRQSQAGADVYRSMALDGSLSVACMSVWAHVSDPALYKAYCSFILAVVSSVPDRQSPTATKLAVCARLMSDSHVRVILSEELDPAWFGDPHSSSKALVSLDYECACVDDVDSLSSPPRSCSPVPGVCVKTHASTRADDDSEGDDDDGEFADDEYWEHARNLLASDVSDILTALASEARALHAGTVCTQITRVSVAMRRHSSDGFEYGLVSVAERGALATCNVCEGCWSGIVTATPDEWPSLGRSVHAYVIRDDASEFACATLDMCCGAVRVSSAHEALLALPEDIDKTRAYASDACWNRLWASVVGCAVFPGASEGVRAQFSDKHSAAEQFASATGRDVVNLGAQDNVLMRLTSTAAAISGSSGRRVYLQSKCSPYFYMNPEIVEECRHSLVVQAGFAVASSSGAGNGLGARSSSEMTYEKGSNPKCILSAYQKSQSSDTTAESACIDHSPAFSSRRGALNNDDAAASYIGMRSLRGLGVCYKKLREIYSQSAWVRRWVITCERSGFCTCSIGASADAMSLSTSELPSRRTTEQVRAQLLWNGVIDSSCLRLFDEANRRSRDIEHSARGAIESRQLMARFRQHSSQVSENVDLYVDRISDEARSDERGYRVLVNGTQYGTVNVRERVLYRIVCSESALCSNFGIWSEEAHQDDAMQLYDEEKHGVRISHLSVSSDGNAKHIDVTIVDARKFIVSAMCDDDASEDCIGSVKVSFGALTSRNRNLFGFIRLVDGTYSGALVTESHLTLASYPRRRQISLPTSSPTIPYDYQSQQAPDSPDDTESDYSEDEDVLADNRPVMYQVGIVFIYTPLKAGISLPSRVYKKRLPLSGPRVRDKEWFFSPMKADPTLDDCSEKIDDLGNERPTTTVLTLSSDTYYRFAVVMDPKSDAPIDEVQCPDLRIYDDDRNEHCVAKLPAISTEAHMQWSEIFAVSGAQQDGGRGLEGGTLQLPVSICADDLGRPAPEMIFRIAHT